MSKHLCKKVVMSLFVLSIFGTAKICSAGDGLIRAEIAELKTRITQLEEKLARQDEKVTELKEKGISPWEGLNIGAGATFVVQGTVDANRSTNDKEDVTDGSYSVDLEIEKEFGDFGLGFVHLETGDGAGVEDELELFSNVNRDADDSGNSVSLTEAWYEQYLLDNQLTLTAGKINVGSYVDQNEIANDECTQFLGHIFKNAPTIDFPDNNAGLHALIAPASISWLELEAQVMDGAGDWEDIFDNIFATYQLNIKPQIFADLSGNYRAYGWYKHTNYSKWAEIDNEYSQFEHKYGFGLSCDQQLTDNFTLFTRYGWCNPDVYDSGVASSSGANFSLEHTCSAGVQLKGNLWGRDQDYIGAAIGMAIPSDKYKDAGADRKADNEGHFEIYYAWHLNDHLTLSPDLHIIWNPFGSDYIVNNERRDGSIAVIGCRGQVDF